MSYCGLRRWLKFCVKIQNKYDSVLNIYSIFIPAHENETFGICVVIKCLWVGRRWNVFRLQKANGLVECLINRKKDFLLSNKSMFLREVEVGKITIMFLCQQSNPSNYQ